MQDIFERVDVRHSGSVYLGDLVAALTCVPRGRSVEVGMKVVVVKISYQYEACPLFLSNVKLVKLFVFNIKLFLLFIRNSI